MPSKVGHVLIDADTLVYRVGFLALPDEEAYRKAIVKSFEITIEECLRAFLKCHGTKGFSAIENGLYFTSRGVSLRSEFDQESVYKEHRKHVAKPKYVSQMKEEIQSRYPCLDVPLELGEADDALSIKAHQYRKTATDYIICGCDKDLWQIPGYHYNYLKKECEYVTEQEANRFFFKQLLMGDKADNIPGLHGIGPVKANYILGDETDVEALWDLVLGAYISHYSVSLTEDEITDIIYERANKLWLRRKEGEIWVPPIP